MFKIRGNLNLRRRQLVYVPLFSYPLWLANGGTLRADCVFYRPRPSTHMSGLRVSQDLGTSVRNGSPAGSSASELFEANGDGQI
jgi:hypothetical protein